MNEIAKVKALTDLWVRRQMRLVERKAKGGENPMIAYSSALSAAVHVLVLTIMKFDESEHARMVADMGTMLVGVYQEKMGTKMRDGPKIILPHTLQ